MPAPKGTRVPNAPRGRRKGAVNKTTRTVREWIARLVDHGMATAEEDYDRIKDPAKKLALLSTLSEYLVPRLQRTELRLPSTPVPIDRHITDIHEATEIYRRVMGDPTLDIAQITFAPQAPRQAALEPLEAPISAPPVDAEFADVPAPTDTAVEADRSNVVELTDHQKLWSRLGQ